MNLTRVFSLVGLFCFVVLAPGLAISAQTVKTDDTTKKPDSSVKTVVQPDSKFELLAENSNEKYRIGLQDTLEVQIVRHPELSITTTINSDGTIRLPRLDNPIQAACRTEQELGNAIADAYRENYLRDPFVNVRAVEQKSQSFSVIGQVEKPGSFFVNRKITLLELLAYAGGPKEEAGSSVIVARMGSNSTCRDGKNVIDENADIELLTFKIKDVQTAKENLFMKPGDIVSVLKSDMVYVYGNVKNKEAIRLDEPKTLLQVIAEAEGVTSTAKKDKIRVLRQVAGKPEREEIVYNLKDIEAQKAPDPFLQPNDIVAVSEDGRKRIIQGIGKTLQQGVPSLFYNVIP